MHCRSANYCQLKQVDEVGCENVNFPCNSLGFDVGKSYGELSIDLQKTPPCIEPQCRFAAPWGKVVHPAIAPVRFTTEFGPPDELRFLGSSVLGSSV